MKVVVMPISSSKTNTPMPDALKLSIVAYLIIGCIATDKCQHFGIEDAFPPDIRHQHFADAYANTFDEIIVIGDVHGCFNELELLLHKVNITGGNVLKILAGDFTRKGPNSLRVLRYVRNTPSMAAVRGNNDHKVLTIHHNATHFNATLEPSDAWIKDLNPDDLEFLKQLPYTISIPLVNAIVVHGGICPGVPLENNAAFDLMNVRNLVVDDECAGGFLPIESHVEGVPWASKWTGPQHVYFAHDHFRNLQLYPFATGLDTSCVYGKFLTGVFIKGPRNGTLVRQKSLGKYVTVPLLGKAVNILENAGSSFSVVLEQTNETSFL